MRRPCGLVAGGLIKDTKYARKLKQRVCFDPELLLGMWGKERETVVSPPADASEDTLSQ
jgi:hypothetical protein